MLSNSEPSKKTELSLDLASIYVHHEATLVRSKSSNPDQEQTCPCCDHPTSTPLIPLSLDESTLGHMGVGYPLFFYTGKAFILILISGSFLVGIPCSLSNLINSQSSLEDKPSNWSYDSSLHKGKDPVWQSVLHLLYCFVLIFSFIYLKIFIRNKVLEIDSGHVTPSDFTVIVKGVPARTDLNEFKEYLKGSVRKSKEISEIVSISPSYDISMWIRKEKELRRTKKQIEYIDDYFRSKGKYPRYTKWLSSYPDVEALRLQAGKIEEWKKQFLNEENLKKIQGTWVFVTFQKQSVCKQVVEDWDESEMQMITRLWLKCTKKYNYNERTYNGHFINIEHAPEPSDILWENITVSTWVKIKKRIKTAFITTVMLLASFYILVSIKIYQFNTYQDYGDISNSENMRLKAISLLLSVTIIVLNFLISEAIKYFSRFEKPATWTQYNILVFHKFVGATTVNTVLMLILVNTYNLQQGYQGEEGIRLNWFSKNYGLSSDVCNYLLVDAFFVPVLLIFDFKYLKLLFKRNRVTSGKKKVDEETAKLIWTNPQMDLAKRSSRYVTTFLVCLLFAPLFPLGLLIGVGSFSIKYGIDKYLLLRRYSRSRNIGIGLTYAIYKWLAACIMSFAISGLVLQIVSHDREGKYLVAPILAVIFASLYVFIPFSRILRQKFMPVAKTEVFIDDREDDFYMIFDRLEEDYERANPLLAESGWKKWLGKVHEKVSGGQNGAVEDELMKNGGMWGLEGYMNQRPTSRKMDQLRRSFGFKKLAPGFINLLKGDERFSSALKIAKEEDIDKTESQRIN